MLSEDTKKTLIDEIVGILHIYDMLHELKKADHHDITLDNCETMIQEYQSIVKDMKLFMEKHERHAAKYIEPFKSHRDDDSDDEELHAVEKFFDCDSHALLKSWELDQFHERMVDEGWQNPLDWVHLDDNILKQNLGFRPGHIQIFNRKFDLWVKRYNDVRRTIDPKRKGKHGVLIVGKGETTTLKSNYLYVFTKVIVREGGTLTVNPWSPTQPDGGVLFINCHQDIVLERDSKISVDGKGYWGSAKPDLKGFGPGGGGSVAYACNGAGGASYAGEGHRGYNIAEDDDVFANKMMIKLKEGKKMRKVNIEKMRKNKPEWDEWIEYIKRRYHDYDKQCETFDGKGNTDDQSRDEDLWNGAEGVLYWEIDRKDKYKYFVKGRKDLEEEAAIKSLECLAINKNNLRKSFLDGELATVTAQDTHRHALGSGGGCNIEIYRGKHGWDFRPKRGGAGGGAVRLWCDRLIMYEKSRITAEGSFDPYRDPFSAGGSGGSIFITVTSEIIPKNRNYNDKNIGLYALGGGASDMDRMYLPKTWSEKEKRAKNLIREFEKIDYPRLKMQQKLDKIKADDAKKKEHEKANYIDSDDDDEEDDGFWEGDDDDGEARTCPGKHDLEKFQTPTNGWYCSECGPSGDGNYPSGTVMHGCRRCNYDLCDACFNTTSGRRKDVVEEDTRDSDDTIGLEATPLELKFKVDRFCEYLRKEEVLLRPKLKETIELYRQKLE
eukprot:730534_1